MRRALTYKTINKSAIIKGVEYTLEEYTTFIYVYNFDYNDKIKDIPLVDFKLTYVPNSLVGWVDQFGNDWRRDDKQLYIPYKQGEPLTEKPVPYCNALEVVIKDALLGDEECRKCSQRFKEIVPKRYYKREYEGDFCPNFEALFPPRFKIGDRVFTTSYRDRDTICGERYQIETFIIKGIEVLGSSIIYADYDLDNMGYTFSIIRNENEVAGSVEELCKKQPNGRVLYMWDRSGFLAVEPCSSTKVFMKYYEED